MMMAAAYASAGVGGRAGGGAAIARAGLRRPRTTTTTNTVGAMACRQSNAAAAFRIRQRCHSCVPWSSGRRAASNGAALLRRSPRKHGGANFQIAARRFASKSARGNGRSHTSAADNILTPPAVAVTPPSRPLLRLLLQSLRHALLRPRSLPLPRWISPQHYSFTLSEAFGHSSFILVAASYATRDFLELRVMAVLGSGAMLLFTYFHPHGRVLWLPLKWNALFIAINSYRIGRVLYDRYMADELGEELKAFREEHLCVIDGVNWYKLVRLAEEETFDEGDLVVIQGCDNHYIRIVLEGELEVLRDGTLTYVVEKGNFVSESGLHAGLMLRGAIESCGTIVVGPPFDPAGQNNTENPRKNRVRCLRWHRSELMDLLENDRGLMNSLQAALSWDIVRKLKMQRHMLADGRVKDPKTWTKKRGDQGISRYASILQNMLRSHSSPDGETELGDLSEVLKKYRRIHQIDDGDHRRALAKCGWTEEEFRSGRRCELEDYEDVEEEELESARWRRLKRYSSKVVRSLLQ